MTAKEAMQRLGMTVFRPGRRSRYVMRWRDPVTGRKRERTTKEATQRGAYTEAGEHALKVLEGRDVEDLTWRDFCELYERHVEVRRVGRAREPWTTTRRWIDLLCPPRRLADVNARWVSEFQRLLRTKERPIGDNTVASYSARLRRALRWAKDQGYLERVPPIEITTQEAPRSRGITGEEFERILCVTRRRRPDDWKQWDRLLRGQWHCGFRIGELLALSWDERAPVHIDHRGRFPFVVLAANANKKRKQRLRAITPEFWAVCCETPANHRRGPVFPIRSQRGKPMSVKRILKMIGAFGTAAGVVTNAETGKLATSHDTRRGFAIRMDGRGLTLAELQKWMDHSDIRTTLTYYRTAEAEQLAAKLWHEAAETRPSGASGGATPSADSEPVGSKKL